MTEYGPIWPIKIRKTEISRPLMVKTKIGFFYRILRPKIRLKNLAKKNLIHAHAHWCRNTGNHKGHFFENPIRDRIKPNGVSESQKRGGNFDRGVFSISVPVSRKLSSSQSDFCRIFGSFCYFLRRWDLMDQNGLQKNDQYKIWNKIGHKTWTFGRFFHFLKKWQSKIRLCRPEYPM